MSYLNNPSSSQEKNLPLHFYYKRIGCTRVIQCHYLGNFASRYMKLISLKNLHFEQYVDSKFSYF